MSFSIKQSTDVKTTTEQDDEENLPIEKTETQYEQYINSNKKPKDLFLNTYTSFLKEEKIQKNPKTPTTPRSNRTSSGLRMFPTQTGQSDFF